MRQKYFVKLEYPSSVRIDSIETSCCGRSIYNDGWSINCGSIGFQGQSTLMCGSEPLSWLVKSFWQKCEYQTSRRNIMKHGQELGYKTTLWGERGILIWDTFWSSDTETSKGCYNCYNHISASLQHQFAVVCHLCWIQVQVGRVIKVSGTSVNLNNIALVL